MNVYVGDSVSIIRRGYTNHDVLQLEGSLCLIGSRLVDLIDENIWLIFCNLFMY